jgi:hypothetical protein
MKAYMLFSLHLSPNLLHIYRNGKCFKQNRRCTKCTFYVLYTFWENLTVFETIKQLISCSLEAMSQRNSQNSCFLRTIHKSFVHRARIVRNTAYTFIEE